MRKLLLLEDDTVLGEGICLALKSSETDVTLCRTLSEGRLWWTVSGSTGANMWMKTLFP